MYGNQTACHLNCFQPGEGPSRGLLRDCENFGECSLRALLSTPRSSSLVSSRGSEATMKMMKNVFKYYQRTLGVSTLIFHLCIVGSPRCQRYNLHLAVQHSSTVSVDIGGYLEFRDLLGTPLRCWAGGRSC